MEQQWAAMMDKMTVALWDNLKVEHWVAWMVDGKDVD
jgi:hypothetical protein